MKEKYKLQDKFLFYIYNVIFSSFFTTSLYFIFSENLSFSLNYFINKDIPTEFDIQLITFLFFLLIFWLFFLFIKLIFLPLLYKYSKNSYTKNFLTNIATINFKEKTVILLKILFFDTVIAFFSILIHSIIHYFIFGNFVMQVYNSIGSQILCAIYSLGGALPCYLSFLIWYKWTHRKKRESV